MHFFLYGFRLPFGLRTGMAVDSREVRQLFEGRTSPYCGAVYVIATDNGRCKIGVSSDVRRRLAQLQTGCPDKLHIVHECYLVSGHSDVEDLAHSRLSSRNIGGEWFACSEEMAIDAVNEAARSFGKKLSSSPEEYRFSILLDIIYGLILLALFGLALVVIGNIFL